MQDPYLQVQKAGHASKEDYTVCQVSIVLICPLLLPCSGNLWAVLGLCEKYVHCLSQHAGAERQLQVRRPLIFIQLKMETAVLGRLPLQCSQVVSFLLQDSNLTSCMQTCMIGRQLPLWPVHWCIWGLAALLLATSCPLLAFPQHWWNNCT